MKKEKHPHGYYRACKSFIKNMKLYCPECKMESYDLAFNAINLLRNALISIYYSPSEKVMYILPYPKCTNIDSGIRNLLPMVDNQNNVIMAYIKTKYKIKFKRIV